MIRVCIFHVRLFIVLLNGNKTFLFIILRYLLSLRLQTNSDREIMIKERI